MSGFLQQTFFNSTDRLWYNLHEMNMDLFHRLFTCFIIIYGFGLSIYFRTQATISDKYRSKKVEGAYWFIGLRLIALVGFLTLFCFYIVEPSTIPWAIIALPDFFRWVGAFIALFVIPFQYWILKSLGNNITPSKFPREKAQLVTFGPYRYIRHPLYFMAIIGFSALFLISEIWILVVLLFIFIVFIVIRIPEEEHYLIEKFGQDYVTYQKKTKKIIPCLF